MASQTVDVTHGGHGGHQLQAAQQAGAVEYGPAWYGDLTVLRAAWCCRRYSAIGGKIYWENFPAEDKSAEPDKKDVDGEEVV